MYRRLASALLVLLLAGACVGGGTNPGEPQPAPVQNDAGKSETDPAGGDGNNGDGEDTASPAESDDPGTVTANPEAQIEGKCTREPQEGAEGEELVSELRVVNTGNLGVAVRISTQWPVGKTEGLTRWTRVRLDEGASEPVRLTLPIDADTAAAVRDAIEQGRRCRVRQRITGAFGMPGEG